MQVGTWIKTGLLALLAGGIALPACAAEPVTLSYLMVDAKSRPFQLEEGEFAGGGGIITDIVNSLASRQPELILESNSFPVLRIQNMIQTGKVKNWIVYNAKVWNTFEKEGRFLDVPLFEVTHSLATCTEALTEVSSTDTLKGASWRY